MKMQKYKIFSFPLIGAIVLSVGFVLPNTNTGFGKSITTAQMASMFGGGWGCPDRDCDTTVTGCQGGNTCDDPNFGDCYDCKTNNGDVCGALQQHYGWMCVDGTKSCNGTKGSCYENVCGPFVEDGGLISCPTRPDCGLL